MAITNPSINVSKSPIIGIFSDAHGNIGAFRLGIEYLRIMGINTFYYLGDAVGYIPCIDVVDELAAMDSAVKCVSGNHEKMLLYNNVDITKEAIYQHNKIKTFLTNQRIEFLKTWPTHIHEVINDLDILFLHGGPNDFTNEYVYPNSDFTKFEVDYNFVFMGHSHFPFIRKMEKTTFVNVGSIGLPRDDGRYGAFATFSTKKKEVKIFRFDISKPARALYNPNSYGIHSSVLQLFERRAIIDSDLIINKNLQAK